MTKKCANNILLSFDVDNASASPGARYPLDSASPGKNINLIVMILVNYHHNHKDHHQYQNHPHNHHLPQADWSFRTCSQAGESPFFTGDKRTFSLKLIRGDIKNYFADFVL